MRRVKERVSLRLDADLLHQAREEIATYGGTFTALVEKALRAYLAKPPEVPETHKEK